MHFVSVKDIRQEGKVEYTLSSIILIIICAVLSGHDTWKGIGDYAGKAHKDPRNDWAGDLMT